MAKQLKISVGQCSEQGRKHLNQDFHGVCIPKEPALTTKGIAIAVADGISSSDVSQEASQTAVKSFLEDYYCTAESWSTKSAVQRVLFATNSWLYAQNRRKQQYRLNKDKGYVCTFTSLVIKSNTAHLFHIGDARVYRLERGRSEKSHIAKNRLELLTQDHRVWVSSQESYLARALGISQQLEIDYQALPLETGDTFLLATDGVYEHISDDVVFQAVHENADNLDRAATEIVKQAFAQGSKDNLTAQLIRIDQLPDQQADELYQQLNRLPFPPGLQARTLFDGYEIIRDLYISSRSHVVLAKDTDTGKQVVIKIPSVEGRQDNAYLERFLMEEWIAKRLNNAHILKSFLPTRKRNFLYLVTEYIEGQTLAQWMVDNPEPDIETVRGIIEQIAKGLQGFHRQEMLHQDLRPNNVMIDNDGTVKIIDFGSTFVAGINEIDNPVTQQHILGTAQFTAPEYFLGEHGTRQSDLYSLGCIAYQMLSGKLPYGTAVAKVRSKVAQRRLTYRSLLDDKRELPAWIDNAIKQAVHPDPIKRYAELSEFIYDLKHPNRRFLSKTQPPLIERNPVLFWQGISFFLFLVILYMAWQ